MVREYFSPGPQNKNSGGIIQFSLTLAEGVVLKGSFNFLSVSAVEYVKSQ